MTDLEYKLENAKDKVIGGVKEAVGKVTGDESLELKGKLQSSKSAISVMVVFALISLIVLKLITPCKSLHGKH